MAGLKCANPRCGYTMGGIPERDVPKLRMPSCLITCPACNMEQPADKAWMAYEAFEEDQRKSPTVFSYNRTPHLAPTKGGRNGHGGDNEGKLIIARR